MESPAVLECIYKCTASIGKSFFFVTIIFSTFFYFQKAVARANRHVGLCYLLWLCHTLPVLDGGSEKGAAEGWL